MPKDLDEKYVRNLVNYLLPNISEVYEKTCVLERMQVQRMKSVDDGALHVAKLSQRAQ